jgi:hypothetical protein
MKLGEIAQKLDCKLEGDAQTEVRGVAGIESAASGELTFISNPRYRRAARTTRASAVLIARDVAVEREACLRWRFCARKIPISISRGPSDFSIRRRATRRRCIPPR